MEPVFIISRVILQYLRDFSLKIMCICFLMKFPIPVDNQGRIVHFMAVPYKKLFSSCIWFLLLLIVVSLFCRFLFWTEDKVIIRFSLADGIKVTLVTYVGDVYAIKLDCRKKRVYWLEYFSSIQYIKSADFGGQGKITITEGRFNEYLLGVLGDSLYFLDTSIYRINEMNVSNGNISRKILVDRNTYYDLVLVQKSVQPKCEYK